MPATIPSLLSDLGERIGLPGLAFDENNLCSLVLDDRHPIDLQWQPTAQRLHLIGVVAAIPEPAQQLLIYRLLMEAHLFGMATSGAYFAASEALGDIMLIRSLETTHLDLEGLLDALDDFIPILTFWTMRLAQGVSATDLLPADVAPPTHLLG